MCLLYFSQLKLFFTDSRGKTSSFKNVVLILLAVLMLQLNWRLQHLSLSKYLVL